MKNEAACGRRPAGRIRLCGIGTVLALALGLAAPALPRPSAAAGAAVPFELSSADIAVYQAVFRIQEAGDWDATDPLIATLNNDVLMGRVLFQRYMHPTRYRSSYAELRDWLAEYADLPDADRVHRLAMRRKPAAAAAPRRPAEPFLNGAASLEVPAARTADAASPVYRSPNRRTAAQARKVRDAFRHVRLHLRRGEVQHALGDLAHGVTITGVFDNVERALLAAEIAAAAFANGDDETALELAARAAQEARRWAPEADFTAGIAAWNLGRFEEARTHFETAAGARGIDGRTRARTAFWAARAALATRQPHKVVGWLEIAATEPLTVYGQLALRQLGREPGFGWETPALDVRQVALLRGIPAVRRAIALTQAGEDYWADREMRRVYATAGLRIAEPLMAVASQFGMAAADLRIGRDLLNVAGARYTGSLYPVPAWQPESGFALDHAVLLAFMRQESAFNVRAESIDGAHGLMQLLPSTASFVAGDSSLMRANRDRLFSPEYNLDLGQRYLRLLLESEDARGLRGNLILAVAAYNGGPGNLSRWVSGMGLADDPLIFMEKIPVRETREFVERVLANLWIYRARLGQDSPSLDSLAANTWPLYRSVDGILQAAFAVPANSAHAGNR